MRYKTDFVRNLERFNRAVEHFREVGHRWERSQIQGIRQTGLKTMATYQQFEAWLLTTQQVYHGMDLLPAQA